jgi:hypothetical protein
VGAEQLEILLMNAAMPNLLKRRGIRALDRELIEFGLRVLAALVLLAFNLSAEETPLEPPVQPLPFSHETHAAANMACQTCHPNPDPGKNMGIAGPLACMSCHKTVKVESPAIRQLASLAEENRDIPWTRVYRIPEFVHFSHRLHLKTGNTCIECHGSVATRTRLAVEYDTKQAGCLACHRVKKAPMLCSTCHD